MTDKNVISGASCKSAAKWFSFGNIIAMLLPLPLGVLWFGASIMVYALNRHHPSEKVGNYTQQAAYRFYAVTGFLIVAGTFFPPNVMYYAVFWAVSFAYIVPTAIMDLRKINRDTWEDIEVPARHPVTQEQPQYD